ncbi:MULTISPECIES: hypothetical protein [unclassified Bradyrhizobium]|uniref:hypothetical protein n=1 Tax=unclassified Bradyrhizobium TaxID=2631580 RepID=UPI001FF77562|nr:MULTISPECIES: hypothetical protein [unclassified Bradyrhizobium]
MLYLVHLTGWAEAANVEVASANAIAAHSISPHSSGDHREKAEKVNYVPRRLLLAD